MEFFFFEVNTGRVGKRIVGADLLDEPSAARRPLIGDDDSVERVLLGPAASEPDGDAHGAPFRSGPAQPGMRWVNGFRPPPGRPPPNLVSFFIIFLAWLYCLRKRFTSDTLVPLPRAMRRRRLPLMRASLRRSCFVMELMMASTLLSSASAIPWSILALIFFIPGIMPRISPIEPL